MTRSCLLLSSPFRETPRPVTFFPPAMRQEAGSCLRLPMLTLTWLSRMHGIHNSPRPRDPKRHCPPLRGVKCPCLFHFEKSGIFFKGTGWRQEKGGMNSIAEIDHALKQQGFENLQVRIPRDPISGSSRCSHAHKSLGGHRFGHPRGNSEVGWAFRKGGTKGRAGDLSDSSGQKLTFRAKNWCQHHARGCFQWRVTLQCGYFHERRATRGGLVALSDLPRHGSGEGGEERCHPQYFHRRSLPK